MILTYDSVVARDVPAPRAVARRVHIPSLDGVRGLAVALVMISHFTMGIRPPLSRVDGWILDTGLSGWVGVDLFFVLSGFLITSILLDTRAEPHYFRNFYLRRTLRIFPLYYAILATTLVLPPLLWSSAANWTWFSVIAARAPWFWTYTANVDIAVHDWPVAGVLGHFWSLAVEEQFYIVWPALVWLVPVHRLRQVCVGLVLVAIATRCGLWLGGMELAGYTLMPARMDALAIGAWVATAIRSGVDMAALRRTAWGTLALATVAVFLMCTRRYPLFELAGDVQIAGYTFLALGSAALIVLTLDVPGRETRLNRAFRHPALTFLGKYSYAMYCLHPLVQTALKGIGFTARSFPTVAGSVLPAVAAYGLVAFALTTALALISWQLLEQPFLRLKERFA